MQCDGSDDADVRYRMAIAQTTFGSLSSIWTDHRLSRALKLRTYQLAVCSTLTHASEAWTLTEPVMRSVNGFNSRCLHIITGQDYRVTATAPEYDLLLAIRQRRLRYLGHILRMPESRVVRRALVALAKGGSVYPKGSLFMDCQTMKFHQLVALVLTAARCMERTGQTTMMRRTATVPLDPLGLRWNAYNPSQPLLSEEFCHPLLSR